MSDAYMHLHAHSSTRVYAHMQDVILGVNKHVKEQKHEMDVRVVDNKEVT